MKFRVRELIKLYGSKPVQRLHRRRMNFITSKPARFYVQPKEDTRSILGQRLDLFMVLLVSWLVIFFLLLNFTGLPVNAALIALALVALEALLLNKKLQAVKSKRQLQKELYQAGQKFNEAILNMEPQQFILCVRDILASFPEVHLQANPATGILAEHRNFDLLGTYREHPLGVWCLKRAEENVTPGEVRDFVQELDKEGFKQGILVTTGQYAPGVKRVLVEAGRQGITVKCLTRYGLAELARQAGYGAFKGVINTPASLSGTVAPKQVITLADLREVVFTRKKAKYYFLSGLFLLGGYFLLKSMSLLGLFYLAFAVLNLALALGSLYWGKGVDEMAPLEDYCPEK
jgi:hypothetical protein